MSEEYKPQGWRLTGFYPETYARHSAALDVGLDFDEGRFAQYEAEFLADLAAYVSQVKAEVWDECLDDIEEYELSTNQARNGNPYRKRVS